MKGKFSVLAGLASIVALNGCGGTVGEPIASESEVRSEIRERLRLDKDAGRILSWEADPVREVSSQRIFPDFSVRRNDEVEAFIEYTSPTDDSIAARNEINLLFNNNYNYLYISQTVRQWARSAVDDYSRNGYSGQIPRP
ncbi:MAG TPA: hypothetical protein HA282_04455 [Nanoarchaeota archaeon]|nr:hypothetical protein [Candidatus Pacearchaeota archaeon]HIH17549.1 hypothetical protein [Nanoarchaeota archaeon]HIH34507.1 hypothetical protein [Nanoarchaeota archaeon]HIH51520.1 hypothetical protein [Nanoarchaeota archaeon]HIH66436.1 hypothetical protein [Nanoarchaeota archaeon]